MTKNNNNIIEKYSTESENFFEKKEIQKEKQLHDLLKYHSKREILFKFVFLGDFGVGKTSIIKRYATGTFNDAYRITIGADFAMKTIEWDQNTRINLQIWDIAGHERFGTLTGVYYRYAVGAAIVFDLTRPETFKSVEKWLRDLRRKVNLPENLSLPVIILANKGDITLETLRQIEIVNFCEKFNILAWFITSAKDNVHIDEAMITLVSAALNNNDSLPYKTSDDCETELVNLQQNDTDIKFINNKTNCC